MEKDIKIPVQPKQSNRVGFLRDGVLGEVDRKRGERGGEGNRQEVIFEYLQSEKHTVLNRYHEDGKP